MSTFKNINCTGKQTVRDLLIGKAWTMRTNTKGLITSFSLPGPSFIYEKSLPKHNVTTLGFEIDRDIFTENKGKVPLNYYLNERIEPMLLQNAARHYYSIIWVDWCGSLTVSKLKFIKKYLESFRGKKFFIAFTIFGAREPLKTQQYMARLMGKPLTERNRQAFKNKWLPNHMVTLLKSSGCEITCDVLKYTPNSGGKGAPMITYILSGE